MTSKDTDFLKQRVTAAAQTPQVSDTTSSTSTVDTANTFLENVTADEPEVLSPRQRRLKRLAEQSNANNPDKVAQEETPPVVEDDEQSSIDISDRASKVVSSVSSNVNPLIDRVGSLPTVGGIGLLVLILVILLFTVVVVNDQGDTRLKQLWYMLNGRATIQGRQKVTGATSIPGTTNNITIPGSVNIPGGPGLPGIGINPLNPLNPITINPTGGGGPDLTHASTDLGF